MIRERKDRLYSRYKAMFDPLYSISICKKHEVDEVVAFIDNYWRKNHPLVKSRVLMDWQYYDDVNDTYNFIIARSKESGEIHAIEGFIPTTQFDPDIRTPMTWGAIWKTRADVAPPGLGMVVKLYREHEYSTPFFSEIGISKDAERYNKQLGNTIFYLEPWYMRNTHMDQYKLIEPVQTTNSDIAYQNENVAFELISLEEWEECSIDLGLIPPFKSMKYYEERYLKHPFYNYKALTLTAEKEKEIFFYRVVDIAGSKCIFFVDYIGSGNVMKKSRYCFEKLMDENLAEYILFLCHGINKECLLEAGFCDRRYTNDIVPVYVEPFLKQNVDILCASRSNEITWTSFKGDADQDRPNIII